MKAKDYRFWITAGTAPPLAVTARKLPPPQASCSSSLNSTWHTKFSMVWVLFALQGSSHHSKPHALSGYKNEPTTNPQNGHCFTSRALLFTSFLLNILHIPPSPATSLYHSTWLTSTYLPNLRYLIPKHPIISLTVSISRPLRLSQQITTNAVA